MRVPIPLLPRSPAGRLRLAILVGIVLGAMTFCYVVMIRMPGRSHTGPLPPLTAEERASVTRLRALVDVLAVEIGTRARPGPALGLARDAIERAFADAGYSATRQSFVDNEMALDNVEVILRGTEPAAPVVVVGAHYDSWAGTPGANDNASGTAALLEVARALRGTTLRRSVHFVGFANEEPPYFGTERMGSRHYARSLVARGIDVAAMLSLESMGCYSDRPGSQRYPYPLSIAYPDRGDFIAFVGNVASRGLVRRAIGSFRDHTRFPSEGLAAPASFRGHRGRTIARFGPRGGPRSWSRTPRSSATPLTTRPPTRPTASTTSDSPGSPTASPGS